MPKLRQLSGKGVIKILESFGFAVAGQKGSHVKLVRQTSAGKEVLTIPNHKVIKPGTAKGIFNQVSRYVPASELLEYFYHQ